VNDTIYILSHPVTWNWAVWVLGPVAVLIGFLILILRNERRLRAVEATSAQNLKAIQQQLSNLVCNMPGLAYRCHNDGRDWVMEYVSDGATSLTGYSPQELIGSEGIVFGDLIHPEDAKAIGREVAHATKGKDRFQLQYRIRHRDGSIRWVWEQGILVEPEEDGEMLEGFVCDITHIKELEEEKDQAIRKLEKTLDELKILRGIIPICSSCKNIRNDKGGWDQLEAYIDEHSEANFSHGICPDCVKRLYPRFSESIEKAGDSEHGP
jgi:PAS domain S-box-containing protein